MRFGFAVVLIVAMLGIAQAENLITQGDFNKRPDAWINQMAGLQSDSVVSQWERDGGRDNSGCVYIRSSRAQRGGIWIWRYKIAPEAKFEALRVSGWVKGQNVNPLAAICVQGWDSDRKNMAAFATTQQTKPMSGTFDWTRIEMDFVANDEVATAEVLIFLSGTGEVWFDDIAAKPISEGEAQAASGSATPGLFEARGAYRIIAGSSASPRLLLPMPLQYREQVPITYRLETKPSGAIAAARIYEDVGQNYVAEVSLKPMKIGKPIELHWRSIVLATPRSFDDVPAKAPMPQQWPEESRPWLVSTRCAQASNDRIRKVAAEIRGDRSDVIEIIKATIDRSREIHAGQEGRCTMLDAVQALDKQGSCTSAANLMAALLRANRIPARILAGYPTWSGPLQTHYIVEAYVPGYGWYPIESTAFRHPVRPHGQIHVSIVPPQYEDRCEARPFVAAGVPYLSLTEYVGDGTRVASIGLIDEQRACDHIAEQWRAFSTEVPQEDWARAIEVAGDRWRAWLAGPPQLDAQGRVMTPIQADGIEAKTPAALTEELRRGS